MQKNQQQKTQNPIIAIALDSADPNLIEMWLKEGKLPFINYLIEKGLWTRLNSTANLLSDSPWVSLSTGVHPGKHAYYNFLSLQRGSSEIVKLSGRDSCYLPFWSLFKNTDKKVAIFDIPKTYPIEEIEGIQIAAWGEEYPLLKACSLPKNLVQSISARFGKYRHTRELINPRRISSELQIYKTLMSNIQQKRDAIQFLLKEQDWDLFMTAFGECHYANHQFFHHFNHQHWGHEPEKAAKLGNALPNIYFQLDSAVASLLKGVTDDATIFIFSVHGIDIHYSANHLMPLVLQKLGYEVKTAERQKALPNITNLFKLTKKIIPAVIREFINDHIVPLSFHFKMLSQEFASRIDWQQSKAFFLPCPFQGFISINLKGREPFGVVEPGEEYENICYQICDDLKLLVNPETGKPAIKEVFKIAELFPGENQHYLPDIVFQWADDTQIKQLQHPKFGIISEPFPSLRKTQHSGEGFLIAAGKHINPKAILPKASILDLAPTILYLMGENIPEYMDGNILVDLIDKNFQTNCISKY